MINSKIFHLGKKKVRKCTLAPKKRQWIYSLSSMIHAYPRHTVNIRLDCFLATRVGYSPKWWYTIIPHSHLITHLKCSQIQTVLDASLVPVPFLFPSPCSISTAPWLRPVSFHCCRLPRRGADEKRRVEGLVERFNRACRMSWSPCACRTNAMPRHRS